MQYALLGFTARSMGAFCVILGEKPCHMNTRDPLFMEHSLRVTFGFISRGNGFTSGLGDRYGGILLPGVTGGVGFPGTGEWG